MDIIFAILGEVEIEHDFQIIHVDAARGHVGGDEEFDGAFAEAVEDAFTHGLGHVSVEFVGGVPAGQQLFGEFVGHHFRAAENQSVAEIIEVDEAGQYFDFRAAVDLVITLFDRWGGQRWGFDFDEPRFLAEAFDEPFDANGHGGREEYRLATFAGGGEDALDFIAEAHVQHAVGFVEDDHFDLVEEQGAAFEQVNDASGRADDDLGAFFQSADLAVIALTSVNRHLAHTAFKQSEFRDFFGHLDGEFAGGAQNQDLGGPQGDVDPLDGGDSEGCGFARACL